MDKVRSSPAYQGNGPEFRYIWLENLPDCS